MFYLLNNKFEHDCRKAVFSELSMQLNFSAEGLSLDTELAVFDEMIELITELKTQATAHSVYKPVDPMQKYIDHIKGKTPDEVKF